MATATRLRLRSTITRLQNTATQLQAMWHLARQERPLLSWRRALRPTQHHRWRPVIITTHPAIGVATGAGVPVGDAENTYVRFADALRNDRTRVRSATRF